MPISATMASPIQKAEKFPATSPDRMLSDAPPSRDAITTSLTWADSVDVKTFTSSGMMAPASVPHVITSDSFHQSEPSPSPGIRRYDARKVMATETNDVSQTRCVSGFSKFIFEASAYADRVMVSLIRYDAPEVTIIRTRIMKIQTRSCTWTTGLATATRMNEMSAT